MVVYIAWIVLIAYAASLLALSWNLWRAVRLVREQRALPPARSGLDRWPALDVLIPVKDEAGHIAACLHSVLAQDYPNLRLTVVNDRSTDGTTAAVQVVQARHPEVRRVDIAELPDGLFGKPHALHCVAGDLTGELVAFIDSDLTLRPQCLRTLVHHLLSNRLDWVATMGAPAIKLFWEKTVMPAFGAVTFAWYDPRKISDPNWPDAIGSALMVARRDSYDAIGGHGAVIDIYDEDSELIRIAKRSKQRVSFVLASELFAQRHYGGLANTIRGLTRTCVGGIKTIPRLLYTINALNFVSLLPLEIFAVLAVAGLLGHSPMWWPVWLGMAVVHAGLSTALAMVVYRTAKVEPRYALLHPLGCAVLMHTCGRAIVQLIRGPRIVWRGTKY